MANFIETPPSQGKGESQEPQPWISVKALVVAVIFIFFSGLLMIDRYFKIPFGMEFVSRNALLDTFAPEAWGLWPILIIILIWQPLAKKFKFTTHEMAIINIMVVFGGLVIGQGFFIPWLGTVVGLQWLSISDPQKYSPFLETLSSRLIIKSEEAVMSFYSGDVSVPWKVWAWPCLTWALFLGVMVFMALCMARLVWTRWSKAEQLVFPIAVVKASIIEDLVPHAIITQKGEKQLREALFTDPLLWIGLIISFIFMGSVILNNFYPNVPSLDMYGTVNNLRRSIFKGNPVLDSAFYRSASIDPIAIGALWFVNLKVLFSIWFFDLFSKVLNIFFINAGAFGMVAGNISKPKTIIYQPIGVGACIGLALVYLYNLRRDIIEIFKGGIKDAEADDGPPISHKIAVIGLLLGFVFLVVFAKLLGVGAIWALVFFLVLFSGSLTMARARTESGVAYLGTQPIYLDQDWFIPFFGSDILGAQNMVNIGFFGHLTLTRMSGNLGGLLDSFKMGDFVGLDKKKVFKGVAFGMLIGLAIAYLVFLPYFHRTGASLGWTRIRSNYYYAFERKVNLLHSPTLKADPYVRIWTGIGVVVSALLYYLNTIFVWWPFHHVGFLMGYSALSTWYADNALIAWVIKGIIMRYGGVALYRRVTPAFVGLILGQVLAGMMGLLMGFLKMGGIL